MLVVFVATIVWAASAVAYSTEVAEHASVVELANGDFVRGVLLGSDDQHLQWQADGFTRPFQFALSAVDAIQFAPLAESASPEGEFRFELTNRDLFFADLKAIDTQTITVESARLGRLKLRRDLVQQIVRNSRDASMRVPASKAEWGTSDASHWDTANGVLTATTFGAWLFSDIGLPDKFSLELELGWDGEPDFSFAIGVNNAGAKADDHVFTIEAWGGRLVAQRSTREAGDVAPLEKTTDKSIVIRAYVDQSEGRMLVYGSDGRQQADLKVPAENGKGGKGVKLLNRSGKTTLRHLAVRGWTGLNPQNQPKQARVTRDDGRSVLIDGSISLTDDELRFGDGSLPLNRLMVLDLLATSLPDSEASNAVIAYEDGTRISGKWLSAKRNTMSLAWAASPDALELSPRAVRSISWQQTAAAEMHGKPVGARTGTLEMMDTRLTGWLVESDTTDRESCLVWQSQLAMHGVPLATDVFGRILYRAPKPPPVPEVPQAKQLGRRRNVPMMVMRMNGVLRVQAAADQAAEKRKFVRQSTQRGIYLRSGDTIPCTVTGITAEGVQIESKLTESLFVPHDVIKAVQLNEDAVFPRLDKTKLDRLLTLPRMQRDSPPMHLLFSKQGDALRGSVSSMTDEDLFVEIRLDPHQLSRNRISSIVWLHEDEMEGEEGDQARAMREAGSPLLEVQAVASDGSRFSLFAESFSKQTIFGDGVVLRGLRAPIDQVDQLFLGGFGRRAARSLPYHRWLLKHARDPKFVQASAEQQGESATGIDSPLVGQPAPALKLPMLDGGPDLQISTLRGHCVVLDFWATWCGPCLQVMPQVEEVVGEFEEAGVRLFAVNLEERPEQIRATLERRGLEVAVALDRDGVAAARYQASAIPQTVVIGPDGTVVRVFVGATRNLADELRKVLNGLTQ